MVIVDIGNTTTRVGEWKNRELREVAVIDAADQARVLAAGPKARGVAICSVVPEATPVWEAWAQANALPTWVLHGTTPAPVTNLYAQPERLGADRWAAAAGAVARLGAPVIVVQLGTATIVDAVSASREFIGGAIAVGLETGLEAMAAAAAQLPRAPLVMPSKVLGLTTEQGLQVGAVIGTAALVEGLVRRMKREIGEEAKIALTGGNAVHIAPHLEEVEYELFPNLVLEGTAVIWEFNQGLGTRD